MEALRLGVVPAQGAHAYTINREVELASVEKMLSQGSGCRVVWGSYGAGKTHFLDLCENLALEQNFATARLSLDPKETVPSRPARVYQRIMSCLRVPDVPGQGFENAIDRLVASPAHTQPEGERFSRFFSPYLVMRASDNAQIQNLARDYLRGDPVDIHALRQALYTSGWCGQNVLCMQDCRTFGRMYIHLVTTLASYCRDAGYAGLVLFFDEAERVDLLRARERNYAMEVLKHFASVTMKPSSLAFDPETLYKGGQKAHRALPLRFEARPPLSMLLTLTPLKELRQDYRGITRSPRYDLVLSDPTPQCVEALVQKVLVTYRTAYPDHSPSKGEQKRTVKAVQTALEQDALSFRHALRLTVSELDRSRLGGRAA